MTNAKINVSLTKMPRHGSPRWAQQMTRRLTTLAVLMSVWDRQRDERRNNPVTGPDDSSSLPADDEHVLSDG